MLPRRHPLTALSAAIVTLTVACSGPAITHSSEPLQPSTSSSQSLSSQSSGVTPRSSGTSPTHTPEQKPVTVHLAAAGDILTHRSVWNSAARNAGGKGYDYNPMFDEVRPMISKADLAICHMETPLSLTNTDLTKPYALSFNVPHEVAPALAKAGFDGCDRVGNHAYDPGLKGIESTATALDQAGLKSQGPTSKQSEAQQAVLFEAQGIRIAHLAYGYTSLNEFATNDHTPAEAPWTKHWMFGPTKAAGTIADARRTRAAGVELVVVSMHWGVEYSSTASSEQRELAKALLTSPEVDVILGTHVHVPQPCEKINGKYVIYGMGNFLSNQSPSVAKGLRPETQDGMVVDIALSRGSDGRFTQQMVYQPTHVRISDHLIQLATGTKNPDAHRRVTKLVNSLSTCDAKALG